MKRRNKLIILLGILLPLGSSAQIELILFEYSQYMQQSGPDTLVPYGDYSNDGDNYGIYFEIEGEEIIDNASVSGPPGQEAIPFDPEDGSYELEDSFDTAAEMTAAVPAGTYTFTGTGWISGAFSESVQVPAYSPLTPLKVTNFVDLHSFDPSQPLTIEWEAFAEGQGAGPNLGYAGVIGVEIFGISPLFISYDAWDSDSITPEGAFGLPPTTTSVTIPAGTLNETDFYWINIFFARVDWYADATGVDGALLAAVTGYEVEFPIWQEGNGRFFWANYPIDGEGYVDTSPWLGSLYVGKTSSIAPWVWSGMAKKWLYIPEHGVSQAGGWAYLPK